MKTALLVSIACLFIVGVHDVSAAAVQDEELLFNLYKHQQELNPTLVIDLGLEKLTQSYDNICGISIDPDKPHGFHKRTDDQALKKYAIIRFNLKEYDYGAGGRAFSSGDSQYDKPAWTRSQFPDHYANLMASNRMGCSAIKYGNRHCMFCYYGQDDSEREADSRKEFCFPSGTGLTLCAWNYAIA